MRSSAAGGRPAADGRAHPIRSYVIRRGRITRAQQRALAVYSDRYIVAAADVPVDWCAHFSRRAPLWVEIGCGYGMATAAQAAAHPQVDCVAFEVHTPGVGSLMNRLAADEMTNVRIVTADAMVYLPRMFVAGGVSRLHIFFPDPWHKARHHKRRLLRADVLPLFAGCLADDGMLRFVTDDAGYAESAAALFAQSPRFAECTAPPSPQTEFARRAARDGRQIFNLAYRRIPGQS